MYVFEKAVCGYDTIVLNLTANQTTKPYATIKNTTLFEDSHDLWSASRKPHNARLATGGISIRRQAPLRDK
jgi:hypothetical protein